MNVISAQSEIGEPISGHDTASQVMAITMMNVVHQQLIHPEVAVFTLNFFSFEYIKVVMQMAVDNDKISGISQWLLFVESSVVKPQSNINIFLSA